MNMILKGFFYNIEYSYMDTYKWLRQHCVKRLYVHGGMFEVL